MIAKIKNNKTLAILITVFVIIGALMIRQTHISTTAGVIGIDTWQEFEIPFQPDKYDMTIISQDFVKQDTSFWWLEFTIRTLFIIFLCVMSVYFLNFIIDEIRMATFRQVFIGAVLLLVVVPVSALIVRRFLFDSLLLQGWYNIIHSF